MSRITLLLISILMLSCASKSTKEEDSNSEKGQYSLEANFVDTITIKRADFYKEIIGNGRLKATLKGDIRFRQGGVLEKVFVRNGQRVSKGDALARLNRTELDISMAQARLNMSKAELELKDKLIGFGYAADVDTATVPDNIMHSAYISSGFLASRSQLELSSIALNNATLYAPFSGIIANLKNKEYENTADNFCTILDDSRFDASFNLLESEIPYIRIGQPVNVYTFSDNQTLFDGVISEINPVVDEKGQIAIVTSISNGRGRLLDGMNVKIIIKERVKDQLVVPKSAVVIRDNMEVLFRFSKDGRAMWTYVNVLMSNGREHSVVANTSRGADLNVGDAIIVSGNLNLGDGAEVTIKESSK